MVFSAAAVGVVQFYHPPANLYGSRVGNVFTRAVPVTAPSPNAFGRSGQVLVRFALPSARVEYPLEVHGDPQSLRYLWLKVRGSADVDTVVADSIRNLSGAELVAPSTPGFYRVALERDSSRQLVDGMTLAVLVPFEKKAGSTLNGYRIGTYIAERIAGRSEPPQGFVEVEEDELDLPLTKHLRIGDFITHDNQQTWPRYAALDPRLLDKLELVFSEVARWQGGEERLSLLPTVRSGFRTPLHNRRVRRAANDSRHQYGDAADVAIDANGDGRITASDSRLVELAVNAVEENHPDLVGGLGVYTRGSSPYVHIDARGQRARWKG
jgi:uncharacterized protein YcbK (DUF882 family)